MCEADWKVYLGGLTSSIGHKVQLAYSFHWILQKKKNFQLFHLQVWHSPSTFNPLLEQREFKIQNIILHNLSKVVCKSFKYSRAHCTCYTTKCCNTFHEKTGPLKCPKIVHWAGTEPISRINPVKIGYFHYGVIWLQPPESVVFSFSYQLEPHVLLLYT